MGSRLRGNVLWRPRARPRRWPSERRSEAREARAGLEVVPRPGGEKRNANIRLAIRVRVRCHVCVYTLHHETEPSRW